MAQHTISIILSVQRMSGVSRECPENRGHIWTQLASFGRIQPIFFNDLGGVSTLLRRQRSQIRILSGAPIISKT